MKLPLEISPMTDEYGKYSGLAPEFFKSNREKCFFNPRYYDDDNYGFVDGCLTLGTRGCRYDFVLVISGEHRGRVFDIDNEGSFVLIADSFEDFYSRWLDKISNVDWLKGQIEFWTNIK